MTTKASSRPGDLPPMEYELVPLPLYDRAPLDGLCQRELPDYRPSPPGHKLALLQQHNDFADTVKE